jgi:hypothetical protein
MDPDSVGALFHVRCMDRRLADHYVALVPRENGFDIIDSIPHTPDRQLNARTHAQTLAASTRSLHRLGPGCCLQSCTVVEPADARMETGIKRSPQPAAAPLFPQQTNNCSKLCPMDVAVTGVRRSDRMQSFADSGQACPSRLSICPLFGCAGHSYVAFGSESASEDRAREQVQRIADPSSQPPASRRRIGTWWPYEGSATELAYSGGDQSHSKGHA